MSKSMKKKLQAKRKKAAAKKVRNAVKNAKPRVTNPIHKIHPGGLKRASSGYN